MSQELSKQASHLEVSSYFVRGRNVLVAQAEFSELFVDYYLHLAEHQIQHDTQHDNLLKTALAAFTLHCASRPRGEALAWTINFQRPLVNLFLGGDTEAGTIVGRIFEDNVKVADRNSFYQEIVRNGNDPQRSYVNFSGRDSLIAAERFYERSEQRPARYFQTAEETFVMVSAHPDYDEDWFNALDIETVLKLAEKETLSLLERRQFQWHCGCHRALIFKILTPVMQENPQALFTDNELVVVNCPRCRAHYEVTREELEWQSHQSDSEE